MGLGGGRRMAGRLWIQYTTESIPGGRVTSGGAAGEAASTRNTFTRSRPGNPMRPVRYVLLALALAAPAGAQLAEQTDSAFVREHYTKHEYHIPMRDGVKLFTIVYTPKDASASTRYPMVMQRTCYSVAPYGENEFPAALGPDRYMMRDKYIFVYQDVRGRYM